MKDLKMKAVEFCHKLGSNVKDIINDVEDSTIGIEVVCLIVVILLMIII